MELHLLVLLQVKNTNKPTYFVEFMHLFLYFCTFSKPILLLPFSLSEVIPLCICMCFFACVNHTSTERSIQFLMGPPSLHSSFLLIFLLLSFLHSQGKGCLNWSRPVKESVSDRETDRRWGEETKEQQKKKKQGREYRKKKRRKRQEGPASSLITEALADPWPWSWPTRLPQRSEVVWKCHCGDSLHCWVMMILCSLPSLSDMISVALCLRLPRATHPSLTRPHKAC